MVQLISLGHQHTLTIIPFNHTWYIYNSPQGVNSTWTQKQFKTFFAYGDWTCNLLFVGEQMAGLLASFDAERCPIITKDSNPLVIANGLQDTNSKVYHLSLSCNPKTHPSSALLTEQFDHTQLWHKRLIGPPQLQESTIHVTQQFSSKYAQATNFFLN